MKNTSRGRFDRTEWIVLMFNEQPKQSRIPILRCEKHYFHNLSFTKSFFPLALRSGGIYIRKATRKVRKPLKSKSNWWIPKNWSNGHLSSISAYTATSPIISGNAIATIVDAWNNHSTQGTKTRSTTTNSKKYQRVSRAGNKYEKNTDGQKRRRIHAHVKTTTCMVWKSIHQVQQRVFPPQNGFVFRFSILKHRDPNPKSETLRGKMSISKKFCAMVGMADYFRIHAPRSNTFPTWYFWFVFRFSKSRISDRTNEIL